MKKVSIVIACYNHEKFVAKSIQSALDQDYPNLEVIVVNDGSTDNSLEIIESFKDDRLVIINQPNAGVIETRNYAISISKGDYILPLDSDDYLASRDVVSAMVNEIGEADLIFGNYKCFGNNDKLVKPILKSLPSLLIENFISATSLFTKEIFNRVGGYSEVMQGGYEDWEFSIRLMNVGKIKKIEKTIFYYRTQKISRNTQAEKKAAELVKTIINNNKDIYCSNLSDIINDYNQRILFQKTRVKKIKRRQKICIYFNILLTILLLLTLI